MARTRDSAIAASPRQRWEEFESLCGDRVRASDAEWARGLSPAERLAVVDDLFRTVRDARRTAGDWGQIDDLAWRQTLREHTLQAEAFRRFDEASGGTSPVADAR